MAISAAGCPNTGAIKREAPCNRRGGAHPLKWAAMRFETFSARADACARGCAIALGFTIPISVALDNILLALLLLAWLASGGYRLLWAEIKTNAVARAALVLFGLLTLGLAYGESYIGDGPRYWAKYIDLVFVPIFIGVFRQQDTREYALKALGGALLASMIVSFFSPSGLLFGNPMVPPNLPQYPVGFKYSITQSLLVIFGAFLLMLAARETVSRTWRNVLFAIALVAVFNVLFVVVSRTGYLILAALLLYYFIARFQWRGLLIAAVTGTLLFTAAYLGSTVFHGRVETAIAELKTAEGAGASATSVGTRMAFWRSTFKIIAEHPLFGAGTGSFPAAYSAVNAGRKLEEAPNPHNEYLLVTAQIGIAGLVALLYVFYVQWRLAARLAPFYRDLARGLVLVFVIGCLFNSLLLDHTEGLFFAWMTGLCFAGLQPPLSAGAA